MNFYILTTSNFKKAEIEKYFLNVGIKTLWIKSKAELDNEKEDYFLIQEQTQLLNLKNQPVSLDKVEECTHFSKISVTIRKGKDFTFKSFEASLQGFIFPSLKTNNTSNTYNWDDIFVSIHSNYSNQKLKEKGIKNSARDLAFSKMTEDMQSFFVLEKQMNLNFNPVKDDSVVNFEPIIYNMISNNPLYLSAYNNSFFKPILNKVLNNGLFVRKAKTRADRNYWLPGVNAGIPLTPKKDSVHELTFMFHDIMHFLFPDFIMTGNSKKDKNIYIVSRMMSEAFTIILADFLFVDVLKKSGLDYDFNKRKIYPLFQNLNIEVDKSSINDIKNVLYKNALFVLLGKEQPLKELTQNDEAFENYKMKYQPFFREDYIWTNNNAEHFAKYSLLNKEWDNYISNKSINNLKTTDSFNCGDSIQEIFDAVFNYFFNIIENAIENNTQYSPEESYKNAYKSYISGQLMIFFKFETYQNDLFLTEIERNIELLNNENNLLNIKSIVENINNIYSTYIDSLVSKNLISQYNGNKYKNIYPIFDPFYVFYDKEQNLSFDQVFQKIFY